MPLTLYYWMASPPVRSVDLVIHALGLKAEYKVIDMVNKEYESPEHMKKHPFHRVPVIDDDGFILWESKAIITYLVSQYGKDDSLYPKDLQKRAIVDQRLHYANDVFASLLQFSRGFFLFDKPKKPTQHMLDNVRECQENVEILLKDSRFIAGNEVTVADYVYVTLMEGAIEAISPTGDKFPLTKAWFERCKSSMKDFDEVNIPGSKMLKELYSERLNLATANELADHAAVE